MRTGVLPNGLRYAVVHMERPKGGVSLRLGVDVGSYEETDAERGLAHFIEHMAFRSTRHFPDNSVDGAFAQNGVAFGRDHNAGTELFSTQFQLDLPQVDPGELARAFTWLRDVADGVVFDPKAIDVERGVVLAEKEARNSAALATQEAVLKFQGPHLRAFDRSPIGTDAVLHAADAHALEAFYRRWYRPDNAVVVMTGDLPVESMEAEIVHAFGSWRADGPMPERAPRAGPDLGRPLDVFARADTSGLASVEVCRMEPSRRNHLRDIGEIRKAALSGAWIAALNQRLGQLRQSPDSKVIGVEASVSDNGRDFRAVCLSIKPTGDGWSQALRASGAELLRFQRAGPTGLEVEHAIDALRARERGAVTEAAGRSAPARADSVISDMLEGSPTTDPRQQLRAFDLAVEDITVADVRTAFDQDWSGAGPLISVVAPEAPGTQEIREAWLETEGNTGLAAYADRKADVWGYPVDKPGEVASRETLAQGQFVRIRFRNGVILNFKQTEFKKNSVAFVISFGSGRRELQNGDQIPATIGGALLPLGGLGKHSFEDAARIAEVDIRDLSLNIGEDSFLMLGEETTPNLSDKLKVAAAFMTDPGFRPSLDPLLRESVEATYRIAATTPALAAQNALTAALAPGSPISLPPKAELLSLNAERIAAVLKPLLTTSSIDVTLVGDIDEKTAIQLMVQSFAALPPRAAGEHLNHDAFYLRYPSKIPPPIQVEHHGPPDKAFGVLTWPLYVASPERRHEEYAIRMLAAVYGDALRGKVRGRLGKTYAPEVDSHMPDHSDQGAMTVALESYPADLDTLMAAARDLAKRLAAGDINADQLESARAPILSQDRQAMQSNARWAAALSDSARDPVNLRDILNYSSDIAAVTLDDVRKAAADWLSREPIAVVAVPAMAAPAPGGQP